MAENSRYIVQVHVGALSALYEALSVEASKQTTAEEIVACIVERLSLNEQPAGGSSYELTEVIGDCYGQECKERSLGPGESPVQLMMLWPRTLSDESNYKFYLREKAIDFVWRDNFVMDPQLIKDYFHRFLYQPKDREYPDLCQLPDLNETTLLDNLRNRFMAGHIYTYVGSILIAVNPFKFFPIYNPKYVKLYQNRRLGPNLPPHIFAVADTAYHCMLRDKKNQCIVISGESGSGKTESTNFLLHHLTALSQKGSHGSGVEQTILSAGPVLEAFGNAKTAHNNNSSRFGKFIQVNYKENGMVHGAVVQKYLLEKSRICTQGRNERNYHVFYYLLQGANEQERSLLHLKRPEQYYYLNKSAHNQSGLDNVDESYEFSRLKQSMEMVGFTVEKQRRLFSVLSAVLLLGNVEFQPRKSAYHHDEAVGVKNPEVVALISELLRVKQETLMQALIAKRARASGETLVINYRMPEAIASRDAMAKCLYGALFDWIVLQVNHALLSKKDTLREHQGNSIGVLDIFGFEDFGLCNSFEQLCINYANEHLQHYFNQHVFKYEQEEYRKEGIRWKNIEFMDNTGCLQLIEGKPNGLLCLLDDQCNFPGATNETLLQKFNSVHKENEFYKKPQKKEAAFIIVHYAGKVKYQAHEMREKNLDLMRQDIVGVLKNSSMAFVRELVGADPVAVFRWAIVRAFFRSYFAFHEAGRKHRQGRVDGNKNNIQQRYQRNHIPNENIISHLVTVSAVNLTVNRIAKQRNTITFNRLNRNNDLEVPNNNNHNRLSWPQFYYNRNATTTSTTTPTTSTTTNNHHKHSMMIKNATNSSEETTMRRQYHHHGNNHGTMAQPITTSTTKSTTIERVLCPDQAKVMQRANQIVMKNKSFRPRERGKKGLKNLQSVKTLAGRTGYTTSNQNQIGSGGKARKQPMTVTAQFQQSLHSLMDTLNQANPFFIRCIKSNAKKIPNDFDEETVQRQLRYTGMLETVRIRRAGFNVRLTYDEFIQLYRILLPKGLLSSQTDVRDFLATLNLDRDNYQLGCSKIFLRESEKYKLDCKLHQQIMASIVTLQRWFRACLERRRFLRMQNAVVTLQSYFRMYLAQRELRKRLAAVKIQKMWRGYKQQLWYHKFRGGIVRFQAHCRGVLARRRCHRLRDELLYMQQKKQISSVRLQIDPSGFNSDEAFTSKGSSQEEIDSDKLYPERKFRDSDESSGILEDLDTTTVTTTTTSGQSKLSLRSTQSLPSVTTSTNPYQHYQQHSQIFMHYAPHSRRSEDIKQEGTLLDASSTPHNKRKVSKTHNTIDLSDIDYVYMRKGSEDSLNSNRSFESQPSQESSSATTTTTSKAAKFGQWSSSVKSETDSESGAAYSAPPIITASDKFSMYDDFNSKRQQHQMYVRPHNIVRREGSKNLPPIRRKDHVDLLHKQQDKENELYLAYEQAPDKAKQMLGSDPALNQQQQSSGNKPKPPSRNARNNRRSHVRSLGEEMTDSSCFPGGSALDKASQQLGTIDELSDAAKHKLYAQSTTETDFAPSKQSLTPKRTRPGSLGPLDLKRRNSDPATKIGLVSEHPDAKGGDESTIIYNASSFRIADHCFRKPNKYSDEDLCISCNEKLDPFYRQGYKCGICKKFFHTKCIQNKKVFDTPCEDHKHHSSADSNKPGRRKHRKHSRAPYDVNKQQFNLTGTSEFTDSTDQIISDAKELEEMQKFITMKICKIESEAGEKPSEVDRLFKAALREFKDNLVQFYSAANKNGFEAYSVKYKDLIANFMQAMDTVCQREQKDDKEFPVTMGVNAFRGFMNEFMTTRAETDKPSKSKRNKKEKKRKGEEPLIYAGHTFQLTIINIPTVCEICSSFFMWPIERGLICQSCKLTCHKKCYLKTSTCAKDNTLIITGHDSKKIFGVPLQALLADDEKVPVVIERLLATIEMYFLYTEGLYRKPGVSSKVKELKHKMEEDKDGVNFEQYQVHVLASVLKCFLREMPEPLLTFECYENFITVATMTDPQDRVSTLYDILKKLPTPNYNLMERLIFHLARVALHEEVNRMSAASLAIVFAPCILRTNKVVPAQDSLHDIGSQTQCIETIISEQLRKIRSTLDDIDTLDTACQAATNRLSSLRSSKVFTPDELLPTQSSSQTSHHHHHHHVVEEEENLLENHIQEIQKEKEHLTSTLPTLTHATSDDDMLSTDGDGSLDDISCLGGGSGAGAGGGDNKRLMKTPGVVVGTTPAIIKSLISGSSSTGSSCSDARQSNSLSTTTLKRQSSNDVTSVKVDECEDAPIMV